MLLKTTKLEKTRKITKTQNPPGGMGSWLERAYSNFLLLLGYNPLAEMLFGPCYLGSKGLQNIRKRSLAKGEASWKLRMAHKLVFGQPILFFSNRPAKNQQANFSKKFPKTLYKCLWITQEIPKKF